MITKTDFIYLSLLKSIYTEGVRVCSRNGDDYCNPNVDKVTFTEFPLITLRKPSIKKALMEFKWFLSGSDKVPEPLHDWWIDQVHADGNYYCGYSHQFRFFNGRFDQIAYILNGLIEHPYSRRLVMTTWNPCDMANITSLNSNPNTPSCCHSSFVQFNVLNSKLYMLSVSRSSDMLLGIPHNWIQSWALLVYLAYHTGLEIGSMQWVFGNAHIYDEESHINTLNQLLDNMPSSFADTVNGPKLVYNQDIPRYVNSYDQNKSKLNFILPRFDENDFYLDSDVPPPVVTSRPKLL